MWQLLIVLLWLVYLVGFDWFVFSCCSLLFGRLLMFVFDLLGVVFGLC